MWDDRHFNIDDTASHILVCMKDYDELMTDAIWMTDMNFTGNITRRRDANLNINTPCSLDSCTRREVDLYILYNGFLNTTRNCMSNSSNINQENMNNFYQYRRQF